MAKASRAGRQRQSEASASSLSTDLREVLRTHLKAYRLARFHIVSDGYLRKRTRGNSGWKRRKYCIVPPGYLFYFKSPSDYSKFLAFDVSDETYTSKYQRRKLHEIVNGSCPVKVRPKEIRIMENFKGEPCVLTIKVALDDEQQQQRARNRFYFAFASRADAEKCVQALTFVRDWGERFVSANPSLSLEIDDSSSDDEQLYSRSRNTSQTATKSRIRQVDPAELSEQSTSSAVEGAGGEDASSHSLWKKLKQKDPLAKREDYLLEDGSWDRSKLRADNVRKANQHKELKSAVTDILGTHSRLRTLSEASRQINAESFDNLRGQVKAAVDFGRHPTVIDEAKVIDEESYSVRNQNRSATGTTDMQRRTLLSVATAADSEPAFEFANDYDDLHVWMVDGFAVSHQEPAEYGTFDSHEVYLLLQPETESGDKVTGYQIYWWIGEDATTDKAAVAAIKACELSKTLERATHHHRVEDSEEGDDFRALFPRGFEVDRDTDSSEASSVLKPLVDPQDEFLPYLLQLKGRPRPSVHTVEPSAESLNSGDVFILDTWSVIYCWFGKYANFQERAKGPQLAQQLKSSPRLPHADNVRLVFLHERVVGDASFSASKEDEKAFWSHLGGYQKPKSQRDGGADSKVVDKLKLLEIAFFDDVEAIQVNDIPLSKRGTLSIRMVKSECSYVLDCQNELFVWYGKESNKIERDGALRFAFDLIAERPDWTALTEMKEGCEVPLFLDKFADTAQPIFPRLDHAKLPPAFFASDTAALLENLRAYDPGARARMVEVPRSGTEVVQESISSKDALKRAASSDAESKADPEAARSADLNEEDYEIDEEALYVMVVTRDNQLEEIKTEGVFYSDKAYIVVHEYRYLIPELERDDNDEDDDDDEYSVSKSYSRSVSQSVSMSYSVSKDVMNGDNDILKPDSMITDSKELQALSLANAVSKAVAQTSIPNANVPQLNKAQRIELAMKRRPRSTVYFWQGVDCPPARFLVWKSELQALVGNTLAIRTGSLPVFRMVQQNREPEVFLSLFEDGITIMKGLSRADATAKKSIVDESLLVKQRSRLQALIEKDSRPAQFSHHKKRSMGGVMTRHRKLKSDFSEYYCQLYHIHGFDEGSVRAVQVECVARNLNSGDVFVLVTPTSVYAWYGKHCSSEERDASIGTIDRLMGDRPIKAVNEGQEDNEFWSYFKVSCAVCDCIAFAPNKFKRTKCKHCMHQHRPEGFHEEYSSSFAVSSSVYTSRPRFFRLMNAAGRLLPREIIVWTQHDLHSECVFMLDASGLVFMWSGRRTDAATRKTAKSFAVKYVAATGGKQTHLFEESEGKESPFFRSFFHGWSDYLEPEFVDPRAKVIEEHERTFVTGRVVPYKIQPYLAAQIEEHETARIKRLQNAAARFRSSVSGALRSSRKSSRKASKDGGKSKSRKDSKHRTRTRSTSKNAAGGIRRKAPPKIETQSTNGVNGTSTPKKPLLVSPRPSNGVISSLSSVRPPSSSPSPRAVSPDITFPKSSSALKRTASEPVPSNSTSNGGSASASSSSSASSQSSSPSSSSTARSPTRPPKTRSILRRKRSKTQVTRASAPSVSVTTGTGNTNGDDLASHFGGGGSSRRRGGSAATPNMNEAFSRASPSPVSSPAKKSSLLKRKVSAQTPKRGSTPVPKRAPNSVPKRAPSSMRRLRSTPLVRKPTKILLDDDDCL